MNWWDENVMPVLLRPEVAGMFGSILSLKFAPSASWWSRFIGFSSGVGGFLYAAPYLTELIHITSKSGINLIAFLCGLLGMNMLSKTVDTFMAIEWTAIAKDALRQWVNK